ncbi:glycoside hydrolase family 28 protein [Favolaschia claudopus]|uniref:galacturonan 1,4-alpha-galacturonidase n=1 Tax=Favolaschia claudopus TaxID=2862362 RepID=A0AAW0BRE4_9AGAR
MSLSLLVVLLTSLYAVPGTSRSTHHPQPPRKHCTVKHNHDGSDDSANILHAFTACATDSVITFSPANYSAYTPITLARLNNVVIHLNGNLLLPNNIEEVQRKINVSTNQPSTYATPWFYFHGSNVQLIGSAEFEWGRFYGFGNHWWDLGVRTLRPQLATFNITNGLMRNLKVIKPVAWGWNLPGTDLRVENHFVDAKPDNGTRWNTVVSRFASISRDTTSLSMGTECLFPENTYASLIMHRYYGHNGDDCISIINGAQNYWVSWKQRVIPNCTGRRVQKLDHGRSGLWSESNWTGGAGFADNVTWEDIKLVNVSTAIFLTQKISNIPFQSLGPPPNVTSNSSTHISNFKYKNFHGGLNANWTCITPVCWNFVEGGDATQSIIFDLYPGTALNISVGRIKVHPFEKPYTETTVICDPETLVPGEQATLGFNCTRGAYVRTPIGSSG